MLLIDGSVGSDSEIFLEHTRQDHLTYPLELHDQWISKHSNERCHHYDINCTENTVKGIIYMRTLPEIAYNRIKKRASVSEASLTLNYIKEIYQTKEELFIKNKVYKIDNKAIPVLVLNANIDFQQDFSQYYNHLFYIKKFIKELEDTRAMMNGTYEPKKYHRSCC